MKPERFFILAIDPGTHKTGLAVLDSSGAIVFRKIIPAEILAEELRGQSPGTEPFSFSTIVIGQGTGHRQALEQLKNINIPLITVEEKYSTDEARRLYWQLNPPRGIKKFIPRGLLVPPEPLDDLAAVIIGRNYLGTRCQTPLYPS